MGKHVYLYYDTWHFTPEEGKFLFDVSSRYGDKEEVLIMQFLNIVVIWVVIPCSQVDMFYSCRGSYCLYHRRHHKAARFVECW